VLILPAATEPVTDLWAEAADVDTAQSLLEHWARLVEEAAS
jgi:mannose-1-phosphate guanylyltransferase/phosphomannomutase